MSHAVSISGTDHNIRFLDRYGRKRYKAILLDAIGRRRTSRKTFRRATEASEYADLVFARYERLRKSGT